MSKVTVMTVLLTVGAAIAVAAVEDTAFVEISQHYEAIRLALIKESTDSVAEHSAAIQNTARTLKANFSAEAAGVAAADAATVQDLLPEIIDRSGAVAAAKDLRSLRSAFAELTKPLARYHALVLGDRPVVAYCPMEKKAWLQPDEPIGNPYAPNMLRCGEVVAR